LAMSQSIDFKKLEQKAFLAYHQDGLVDLIIGMIILCLGVSEAIDSSSLNIIAILLVISYLPLKRLITIPRLGYVKFNIQRGGVNTQLAGVVSMVFLLLALLGILGLVLFDRSLSSPFLIRIRSSPLLLYAILGFIGFGLAGIIIGLHRLLIYALLSLVMMIGGHLLNLPLSVALLLLGGVIFVVGAVLLIIFLRRYPIIESENNGNQ
jgi:hypothetical protein